MTKKRVLFVHPDQNMLDGIGGLLSDLSNESQDYDLVCWRGRTMADALQRVAALKKADALENSDRDPIDLLVTALDIAANDTSPVGAGEHGGLGLELVRTLRSATPQLRAVIVSGKEIVADGNVNPDEECQWVCEGHALDQELKAAVNRSLKSRQSGASGQVELWISLSSSSKGCGYQFQQDGERPSPWRPIDMDPRKLKRFVEQSRLVHVKEPTWEYELRFLGEAFAEELLEGSPNNIQLRDDLNFWKGKVHGIEHIRVRFSIEDDLHAIAVEALKQGDDNGGYWMDRTAIYRGLEAYWERAVTEPRGLFQDAQTRTGPINVLIIRADIPIHTTVKVGEQEIGFDPLPRTQDEVAAIAGVLAKIKGEGKQIGEVRVISTAQLSDSSSFGEVVEKALKNGKWHIVHYAGHTYYDAAEPAGYLFFPCLAPIRLEPIKSDLFAWMLRKSDTRFVFLSSCQSAGQDFIYHLAQEHIPAIMGFLWMVKDERAVDFAKSFYDHLFVDTPRTLENACFEAKREMHAKFSQDPIWASPVLVMQ